MIVVEPDAPAAADHDDVVLLAALGEQVAHVVILPHAFAVDPVEAVAGLQALGALVRAAVHEGLDDRGAEAARV